MALSPKPPHMDLEVYRKLNLDTISPAIKEQIISACSACCQELIEDDPLKKDESVEHSFDETSQLHAQIGMPVILGHDEIVAHIRSIKATSKVLQRILGQDSSDIEQKFRWLCGFGTPSPTKTQMEDAEEWFE